MKGNTWINVLLFLAFPARDHAVLDYTAAGCHQA